MPPVTASAHSQPLIAARLAIRTVRTAVAISPPCLGGAPPATLSPLLGCLKRNLGSLSFPGRAFNCIHHLHLFL